MPQKQKVAIGLAAIAVMVILAVTAYLWSTDRLKIGAAANITVSPAQLLLTVDQVAPVQVTGGNLPYGGFASSSPDVAIVDSFYSYSASDVEPMLSLVVKAISPTADSATIKVWDDSGSAVELPVVVSASLADINQTAKFTNSNLKVNLGEQCDATLESTNGDVWTSNIISDPSIATVTRVGAANIDNAVKTSLRVYGAKVGTNTITVKNKNGADAQLSVEVVRSGGTCANVQSDLGTPQLTSNVVFAPGSTPPLLVGQMLAVRVTADKLSGYLIDKPDVVAVDSWHDVNSTGNVTDLTLRAVGAGTANLYVWNQQGEVSEYPLTVSALGEVNTQAKFNPKSATVKVGEQADLIVDLAQGQPSQWVSIIAGDNAIAPPVRFGTVQNNNQAKVALRVLGVKVGATSYILIHKDGSLAKVNILVSQ